MLGTPPTSDSNKAVLDAFGVMESEVYESNLRVLFLMNH